MRLQVFLRQICYKGIAAPVATICALGSISQFIGLVLNHPILEVTQSVQHLVAAETKVVLAQRRLIGVAFGYLGDPLFLHGAILLE